MEFVPLTGALGAEVSGADLTKPLNDGAAQQLYNGLIAHQVLVFRGQMMSPEAHLQLAEAFGEIDGGHPVYPHVAGFPSIVELIADGDHPPDTEDWHKDLTFKAAPPFASILRAVSVPETGGIRCGQA